MKKYLLLIISIVLFFACEDKQEKDCADVEGGTATVDDCGICTGGITGEVVNYLKDCSGVCNGTATQAYCDSCTSATFDCAGICDGPALSDCAGVCGTAEGEENICGCTEYIASNYNPEATHNDGSCEYSSNYIFGCTDYSACNYNSNAIISDYSCWYSTEVCWSCDNAETFGSQPPMYLTDIENNITGYQGDVAIDLPICLDDNQSNQDSSRGPSFPIDMSIMGNNAYPNPFDEYIYIDITISNDMFVNLGIYNLSDENVRTIISGNLSAGNYQFNWDGVDNSGNELENCYYKLYLNESCFLFIRKKE